MLKNRVSVPQEQDCFYKLQSFFLSADTPIQSKIGILHSRYASNKGLFKNSFAHPHFDIKNRIALFHNGFIANQKDLQKELKTVAGCEADTDSQLIARLIGIEMDEGLSAKEALKNIVEKKLMGTWKLAMMSLEDPTSVYLVKNSGEFMLGKNETSVVITSEPSFF